MIRLTFHSNGYNWEKYLLWLNSLYFQRYGRFYAPLVEILDLPAQMARGARKIMAPSSLVRE